MEYLNNFQPSADLLEERSNQQEFARAIILDTFVNLKTKHPEIKGVDLKFDPEKIVFEGEEVLVEFHNWNDEPIIEYFQSYNISGMTSGGFTAAEMFFKLMTFQKSIDENAGDFKEIKYVEERNWNGKILPLFRVRF